MASGMKTGTIITKVLRVTEEMRSEDARIHATNGHTPSSAARNRAIVESLKGKLIEAAGPSQTKRIHLRELKQAIAEEFYLEYENVSLLTLPYVKYHRAVADAHKQPTSNSVNVVVELTERVAKLEHGVTELTRRNDDLANRLFAVEHQCSELETLALKEMGVARDSEGV